MNPLPKAILYYYLTGMIVVGGLVLGSEVLKESPIRGDTFEYSGEPYTNWDAQWYQKIATRGYDYSRTSFSSSVFFPAYPALARILSVVTGMKVHHSLLLISNACLIGSICVILRYIEARYPGEDTRLGSYAVVALLTLPASLFFRVNYSESLFLLVVASFLLGMIRRRPLWALALLVGFATAIRPVGVGLIPPLVLHAWHGGGRLTGRLARIAAMLLISIWGIAAFSAYLYWKFDDPLAFVRGQDAWSLRPGSTLLNRVFGLLTLEPVRAIFDPSSGSYWFKHEYHHSFIFNMLIMDAAYFVAFSGLIAFGAWRRWLDAREVLTAALLMIIPYCTNGYTRDMISTARYSSVVIPAYMVLGRLLVNADPPMVSAIAGLSGFFLGAYTALFSTWHIII